jgi:hypothetical protein
MDLKQRLNLLIQLGDYIRSSSPQWLAAKEKAHRENNWFIPEFIDQSALSVADGYLHPDTLSEAINTYHIPDSKDKPANVGIVMAGNIPMVGFHDFLCTFLSGHHQTIKLSSKDNVLIPHLVDWLFEKAPELRAEIAFSEMLKGCDAYIATGSNNSARYFEYYFSRFPHIIRKNRTGVAILNGNETHEQLTALADDVYLYFGLGCRNVTKIYVPEGYNFEALLEAFRKYNYLFDHHKYKNNYDYQLALLLLNNKYYMTNGSILLQEAPALFSAISMLNFEHHPNPPALLKHLNQDTNVQCVVGEGAIPFGRAQSPGLTDFADGIDSLQFLLSF